MAVAPVDLQPSWMLPGQAASPGYAIAEALLWRRERVLHSRGIEEGEEAAEGARLKQAFTTAIKDLDQMLVEKGSDLPSEITALVEVHIQILSDKHVLADCLNVITSQKINAEGALQSVERDLIAQFETIEDDYLRSRQVDVQQAFAKVFDVLTNRSTGQAEVWTTPFVLFADDLSVTDLVALPRHLLKAIVLSGSTINAHISIVACDWGLPALINTHSGVRLARSNDLVIVDAVEGMVWGNPPEAAINTYQGLMLRYYSEQEIRNAGNRAPAVSRDGQRVAVKVNVDGFDDSERFAALADQCDGIGLFRTEFLFMAEELPDEEEQTRIYQQMLRSMRGLPCCIRTFDNGVDKPFGRSVGPRPSDSQLGLRSSRFGLKHPELLLTQFRALLRASVEGQLAVLIPMLSHHEQALAIRALWRSAQEEVAAQGQAFSPAVRLGVMVEVPSVLPLLPRWSQLFDFFSVGSNDLVQYLLAADRLDEEVASLYTPCHPAVIRALADSFAFHGGSKPFTVSLCGSLAGEAFWCRTLLLLGLREFSIAPSQVAAIKHTIRQTDIRVFLPYRQALFAALTEAEVKAAMQQINALP